MTKKRLILTALIGTIAIGTLSASITLAWYGASNLLSVNYFDITIVGNTTLKLSTSKDLDSFREDLTSKQLKEDMEKDFLFEPVSSMYKSNWMDEQKDMPTFYSSPTHLTPSSGIPDLKEATTGFFSKKIYFLSNFSYNVTLDVDKCLFENDKDSNFLRAQAIQADMKKENPDTTVTVSDVEDSLNNLINCLRVSILVNVEDNYKYYIVDPTKEVGDVTTFGGLLDNDNDGYYDTYYEPHYDANHLIDGYDEKETIYGEVNDRSYIDYDPPLHDKSEPNTVEPERVDSFYGNCFTGMSKETVYTYNAASSRAKGLTFANEESLSLTEIREDPSKINIPCYKDVITEVVISFYLEGWDRQCINGTMGASFNTKLSFKLNGGII